jgi:hypothetical protein
MGYLSTKKKSSVTRVHVPRQVAAAIEGIAEGKASKFAAIVEGLAGAPLSPAHATRATLFQRPRRATAIRFPRSEGFCG